MTSASVSNVLLNPDVTQNIAARAKQTSSNQDFSKIMGQAKDKVQQTVETKNSVKEDPQKTQQVTDSGKDFNKQAGNDIRDKFENTAVTENNAPNNEVDDARIEELESVAKELVERISEELDVSVEELEEIMEIMGIVPVELFDGNNIANLISKLTEDGNMIGLVADENLYGAMQDLVQVAQDLLNEIDMNPEELEIVTEQVKLLKNPTDENGNIIDFEKFVEAATNETEEAGTFKEVSVTTENNSDSDYVDATATTSEVQVTVEKTTEKETDTSKDDSDNSQHDMPSFLENAKEVNNSENVEMTQVSESELPSTESILRQIADSIKIQKNVDADITKMEISLHPSSLGNVNVSLSTKSGVVTAQFTAQNETVKNAIETQVVQLRADLEEQGVKVDAIEVSVASHQMERNLEQGNDRHGESENENKTEKVSRIRRGSINLNKLLGEDGMEEIDEEDDATRIAMEMMTANGNTMDLLA